MVVANRPTLPFTAICGTTVNGRLRLGDPHKIPSAAGFRSRGKAKGDIDGGRSGCKRPQAGRVGDSQHQGRVSRVVSEESIDAVVGESLERLSHSRVPQF